tara:strand:+ start:921 stop:1142 length:222 start_codon:yes stop_codon:yes gene_type:complete
MILSAEPLGVNVARVTLPSCCPVAARSATGSPPNETLPRGIVVPPAAASAPATPETSLSSNAQAVQLCENKPS